MELPGFEFRNPPVFLPTVYAEPRQALAEVESLIDHLFHHPNTAPFISYRSLAEVDVGGERQTSRPHPALGDLESIAGLCAGRGVGLHHWPVWWDAWQSSHKDTLSSSVSLDC